MARVVVPRTPEWNAKIGAALRGREISDTHRANMSKSRKGRGLLEENPNWRGGDWANHGKEKSRVVNAHRHASKHGRVSTLTLPEWLEALEEYNYTCAYCLGPFEQLDHVKAIAFGGNNTRSNVVPSCGDCNRRKTNRLGRSSGWVPSVASRFWPRLAEELYS